VLERRGRPFIALQENLAVGVSETRTCLDQGSDMFGLEAGHVRPVSLEPSY
jgi:hypothetical protein